MKIYSLFLTFLCLFSGYATAAVITFEPTGTVTLGSTFMLEIIGTGFTGTEGGGATFTFDETLLQVNSVSIDTGVWDFATIPGAIDNANGDVAGIAVAAYVDPGASFTVATVEFAAIGIGSTSLVLSENPVNLWASGGSEIYPTLINGDVIVVAAVPVPPALYLFGSGLLGLVGLGRRKLARSI